MATYQSIAYSPLSNASSMVLLQEQTVSSAVSTLSFTSGIDSTYKEYVFKFINTHPSSDPGIISFQATTDGTNYNVTITSSFFRGYHAEDDGELAIAYAGGFDQAQGTAVQNLESGSGNDNDQASSGYLHLYDPSNTTFVKHFTAQSSDVNDGDVQHQNYAAGYFNTTSAITGVRFSMAGGTINSGIFKMYGVK